MTLKMKPKSFFIEFSRNIRVLASFYESLIIFKTPSGKRSFLGEDLNFTSRLELLNKAFDDVMKEYK